MFRACASRRATVCSAAETMLDCGAFTTITPRRVAASTSTLSRPIPARATTLRFSAASMTAAVTCVCERTTSASYGAIASARPSVARSVRTSTWKSLRRTSSPASERFSVTRTLTGSPTPSRGLCLLEHALGCCDGRAPLHRVAEPLERHLERREAAHDVELAEVPEVPDPEHLALERALSRSEDTPEIRTDPPADRVRVDALGRAYRGDGPVVLQALAEQVEPERLDPLLHGAREHPVPGERRFDAVLEVELEGGVQALHHADRGGPGVLGVRQVGVALVDAPVEVEAGQGRADGAFCEPPIATSTPHASKANGTAPRLLTTSAITRAPASFATCASSRIGWITPGEGSGWGRGAAFTG